MTNTEREEFELAALAAGIDIVWDETLGRAILVGGISGTLGEWNPKTSGDDALRLAVKLKTNIYFDDEFDHRVECVYGKNEYHDSQFEFVDFGDDPYAATRLAIFRAGVAVGRRMRELQGILLDASVQNSREQMLKGVNKALAFIESCRPQKPKVDLREWQPIETAPLGMKVLLWHRGWRHPFPGTYVGDPQQCVVDTCEAEAKGWITCASHWKPLPAAPKKGE